MNNKHIIIITFLITFMLGFSLVIPIFTKKDWLIINVHTSDENRYLIITDSTLYPGFSNFTNWKQWQGYNVTITTISDFILNNSFWVTGYWGDARNDTNPWMEGYPNVTNLDIFNDTQCIIRNYIRYQVYNNSVNYVLLGGLRSLVPVRENDLGGDWQGINDHAFFDSYYYCLNGSLNENENDLWGEVGDDVNPVDHIDYNYDVLLGRVPVSSITDVENITVKSELYSNATGAWLFNLTFIQGANLEAYHFDDYLNTSYYFDEGYTNDTTIYETNDYSDTELLLSAINNGTHIIFPDVHGTSSHIGWYDNPSELFYPLSEYNDYYVPHIKNSGTPNFWFIESCYVGGLRSNSWEDFPFLLMNNRNGSFGLIATQALSLVGANMYDNFIHYLLHDNMTYSEAFEYGIQTSPYPVNTTEVFGKHYQWLTYTFYGDPSIKFNINRPNTKPVIYDEMPTNNSYNRDANETLYAFVDSYENETMDVYFMTNATGTWQTIGSNLSVTKGTFSQAENVMWHDYVTYYWSVNATEMGSGEWTNKTFEYTVYENKKPVLSNFYPDDHNISVNKDNWYVSVDINDAEGETFVWNITTYPDVGTNDYTGGSGKYNGTKICYVQLDYETTYLVNVSARDDGSGRWTNETYTFTVLNNSYPTVNLVSPSNGSTGVSINPELIVSTDDIYGDNVNVTYWTNASGTWQQIGINDTSLMYHYLTLKPNGNYSTNDPGWWYDLANESYPVGGTYETFYQWLNDNNNGTYLITWNGSGVVTVPQDKVINMFELDNITTQKGTINNVVGEIIGKVNGTAPHDYNGFKGDVLLYSKGQYLYLDIPGNPGGGGYELCNNSYWTTLNKTFNDSALGVYSPWAWGKINDLKMTSIMCIWVGDFGKPIANTKDVFVSELSAIVNYSNADWTLTQIPTTMTAYNTKYYWSVNVTDGELWTNKTYSFTTKTAFPVTVNMTMIEDTVISSRLIERNTGMSESRNSIIRLNNSQYYLSCAKGESSDGWIRTFIVYDNGTIGGNVSWYQYDGTDATLDANIIHIPETDKYAICYADTTGTDSIKIITVKVYANNGTIVKSIIDTQNLQYVPYATARNSIHFLNLTDRVYCVVFRNATGNHGCLETIWINSSGTINNTILDKKKISSALANPDICVIDSDTIAIAYTPATTGAWLVTRNISSSGIISSTNASSWGFDKTAVATASPDIYPLGSNRFAMSYSWSGTDGKLITFSIDDTGRVSKSNISGYEFDEANCLNSFIFPIINKVYGIAYQGTSSDGWICTIGINSTGIIDTVYDRFEFDSLDSIVYTYPNVISVANNYYLIAYTNTTNRGMAKTISIDTNSHTIIYIENDGSLSNTPSAFSNGRKIARDSNGYLYCVFYYTQATTSKTTIKIGKSIDEGASWTCVDITTTSYNKLYPSIAIDSNNKIHVVWQGYNSVRTTVYQIEYSYSIDNGTTWSTPYVISKNIALRNQYYPSIAVNSTNAVFVVWHGTHAGSTTYNQLRFSKSTNGGVTWSEPSNITSTGSYNKYTPSIAIDENNKIHIVAYSSETPYRIYYTNSTDGGSTWATLKRLTTASTYNQLYPSIATDTSNNIYIVWHGMHSGSTTLNQIRFSKSTNSGITWTAPSNITTSTTASQTYPSISLDKSNNLHVIWFGGYDIGTSTTTTQHLLYAYSSNLGTSWTTSVLDYGGITTTESVYPGLLWSNYPKISGIKTNVPKIGYLYIYGIESIYMIYSRNLTLSWGTIPTWSSFGWNISFKNSSRWKKLLFWNLSFRNSLFFKKVVFWNTSFKNTVTNKLTTWFNISFQNSPSAFKQIWYNSSFKNVAYYRYISYFNTSFNSVVNNKFVTWFNTSFKNLASNIITTHFNTSFKSLASNHIETTFNTSFENAELKLWKIETYFNTSFKSTTSQNKVISFNSSFKNAPSFKNTIDFNVSFKNIASNKLTTSFNTSFKNTAIWTKQTSFNTSFKSTSLNRYVIFFNTSFQNIVSFKKTMYFNTSFRNSIFYHSQIFWNISFKNNTQYKEISQFNVSFKSITQYKFVSMNFNTSFQNYGMLWNIKSYFNISFENTSIGYIIFTNEYPVNLSVNVSIPVILHLTVESGDGYLMNLTWYYGNSSENCTWLLTTFNNVSNDTYYVPYLNVSQYNQTYYWKVNGTDGHGNSTQETYHFTTAISAPISVVGRGGYGSMYLAGIETLGMLGTLGILAWFYGRKKEEEE